MTQPQTDLNSVPVVEMVPGGAVDGGIRPPGSKSLTNRALVCAAFADGQSTLSGALQSEDTEVMIKAIEQLGVSVDVLNGGTTLVVDPNLNFNNHHKQHELFIANSGTTIRFLTAALSAVGGRYKLYGVDRMHQRPIGHLVNAIEPIVEGSIEALSAGGCPPVVTDSSGWLGNRIEVAGSVSSQYLSGLMMACPIAQAQRKSPETIRIHVVGELVSRPYVDMTVSVMRDFGAQVNVCDDEKGSIVVEVGCDRYRGVAYSIEPDASAASYFWATAAISGGTITVEGLSKNAMQGDVGFCDVLEQMGCLVRYEDDSITVAGQPLVGVDVDMNAVSDTVQTLSVVALFAAGPTRIRGVAHNRYKETDRIGDLARELRKLGAKVEEHEDGLTIVPPQNPNGATLETYSDHRMAMSLSLAGLKIPGVRICDPACTTKTYPEFFADMERLIGRAHRWGTK